MIYLNNGATSWPKPQCVTNTVKKALEALPCSAYRSGLHCAPLIHKCLKTSQGEQLELVYLDLL